MLRILLSKKRLKLQGHCEELEPTLLRKFLPSIPWELRRKVVGILPPILVAFWGPILVQNLPSISKNSMHFPNDVPFIERWQCSFPNTVTHQRHMQKED